MVSAAFIICLKNYLRTCLLLITVFLFTATVTSSQITGVTSDTSFDNCQQTVLQISESPLDSSILLINSIEDSASSQNSDNLPVSKDTITPNINSVSEPHTLGAFDMFTNLPGDWYRWSKQTFTTGNIPLIAALGVMTAGMVVTDYELWQPAKKLYDKSKTTRVVSDAFVGVGDGKFQFGLAVGFGLYGVIFSNNKALRTASQVTEVILACGGVVQLLKHVTGRESPFVATSRTGEWRLFPNQIEYAKHTPHYDAFPSGHIATAMATMIVISENYPEQKWIKYIGYPAVMMVGVGLTTTSIHWVSDFPLGLALGYSFGMLIAHQFDEPKEKQLQSQSANVLIPKTGITMLPNGLPALQLSWEW